MNDTPSTATATKVGVYRLQLFKPSETFIAAQAKAMPTADPLLIGRAMFGPPDPALAHWIPADLKRARLLKFLATANPTPYLAGLNGQGLALLHAHFSIDGLYALPLAKALDIPLVTTLHGFDITTSRKHFLKSGRPALVRYAMLQDRLKADGSLFICVSRFIRDAAIKAGIPEKKLCVHYIGIDTSQFEAAPVEARPRFVHVARLVEKKGTRYLLDAFAQVNRKHPDILLDIIGDGPLRPQLEARAIELGIAESVRFLGVQPHDKVRSTLQGASALVLPSVTAASGDAEGLGIVLLEASASGVPVIGTYHGGIPEAVDEGKTGLLVPERDIHALALALDTLVSDASLQQRMGLAARQFARERFDIHRQSAELERHYASLCK